MWRDHVPGGGRSGSKRKECRGEAEKPVFEREGGEEHGPRGAERLQDDGVLAALAMAGGERAAEHQHRDDERQRRRDPDGERKLGDDAR